SGAVGVPEHLHQLAGFVLRSVCDQEIIQSAFAPARDVEGKTVAGSGFFGAVLRLEDEHGNLVQSGFIPELCSGTLLGIGHLRADQLELRIWWQLRRSESERQLSLEPWLYFVEITGSHVHGIGAREIRNMLIHQARHHGIGARGFWNELI